MYCGCIVIMYYNFHSNCQMTGLQTLECLTMKACCVAMDVWDRQCTLNTPGSYKDAFAIQSGACVCVCVFRLTTFQF